MTNHPSRKKRRASRTNLPRVMAFADHGEELLTACKALLADIEARYGSIDGPPNSVKGVRLMSKVLGDIRRAHEAIAKIEGAVSHDAP